MKKTIFLIISLSILIFVKAQNKTIPSIDSRLFEIYSSEFLLDIQNNNPQALEYMNWYLDHSFEIIELPQYKIEFLPELRYFDVNSKTIGEPIENLPTPIFNIHKFYFERKNDLPTTYKISNTGIAIVFFSEKELVKKFKEYQNEK